MENEKVFFLPGDVVKVKHNLDWRPAMYVVKKESKMIKDNNKNKYLLGIICRWFTADGLLQEAVFNTKDLTKDID